MNPTDESLEDSSISPSKLVLLGESAVGKSSLVLRFVRSQFIPDHDSTIGAAFLTHVVEVSDGSKVKLEIWDTAGQERFRSLTPMYYRGAKAAIVVFDLTLYESFLKGKSWVKELQKQDATIKIFMAGNKSDLKPRKVDKGEASNYCHERDVHYYETSAKTGDGVSKLFMDVATAIPGEPDPDPIKIDKDRVGLIPTGKKNNSKPKCKCGK